MSPSRTRLVARALRWAPAGAVLALAPKCVGCLALYLGIGAVFGLKLGGPEICGEPASKFPVLAFAWFALCVSVSIVLYFRRHRAVATASPTCSL